MSAFDDLKLNWQALDQATKRKIILVSLLVVVLIVPMAYQVAFDNKSTTVATGEAKSASGKRALDDSPDVAWITGVGSSNAAFERRKLRDELEVQANQNKKFQQETTKSIDGIEKNVTKIADSVDVLSLAIAKESAERKQTMNYLSQRLQDVANGMGFDPTDPDNPANNADGGSAASNSLVMRGGSSAPKGASKVTVSPFDMLSISKATGVSSRVARTSVKQKNTASGNGSDTNEGQAQGGLSASALSDTNNVKIEPRRYTGGDGYSAMIPSGSIIRARLVSGMDAMVSSASTDGNQPVIAKITEPLLLPNGHRVDLRGCVVMAGGYGNLSTERVYMNTTILSCIGDDDIIYETPVSANALGSDGKLGIRGVMVTRDGALILRTMQAGLLQGIATAFSDARSQNSPVFSTEGNQFQFPDASYVGKSSLVEGVNKSLERLVNRYNNILDQIFPVLQVDAGRMIEFQVLSAFQLDESI